MNDLSPAAFTGFTAELPYPPVGILVLRNVDPWFSSVKRYSGISFCHAVSSVAQGQELLVTPESISLCRWCPQALGLKAPDSSFESGIAPRLEGNVAGIYCATPGAFRENVRPDVVLVRASVEVFRKMTGFLGRDSFSADADLRRDATSLGDFFPGKVVGKAVGPVNRILAVFSRSALWRKFVGRVFRGEGVTALYDRIITRWLVNMSVCRNASVIPILRGKGNITRFCTGAIAWGGNDPSLMVAGFPWDTYRKLAPYLEYTGSDEDKKSG